jgi:DNA-3-methyladenine glycosylase
VAHRITRYSGDTLSVATRLLGKKLCTIADGVKTSGIIVEVEAYHGETDEACHCYHRRTPRNEVMFWEPGHCYVYLIYGLHYCVNVVTEAAETGAAVLIRALQPVDGIPLMTKRRGGVPEKSLTNGPAKLCQSLGIDSSLLGHHLSTSENIWIEPGLPSSRFSVQSSTRIGISKATELRWRFLVADSPWISKKP